MVDVPMIDDRRGEAAQWSTLSATTGLAELRLRSLDGRGEVPLGGAQPSEFQVSLIPGTYAFEYDWRAGVDLPRNRRANVRRLRLSRTSPDLILNVPSVIQDFAFLHNGQAFPPQFSTTATSSSLGPTGRRLMVGPTYERRACGPADSRNL